MTDLIGKTLGRYEIVARLGVGGMATVYRARQQNIGRDVAIKVIKSDYADSPDFIHRFEREARTIAALSHLHIVKLFDYGGQGEQHYLVTELMTGGSLDKRISAGPMPMQTVSRMLDQIASALDYAHSKGVIHRDLKPQNVLLDEADNAHLTDFGIAKLQNKTALTQSGTALGTPTYMSPEQCRGQGVDSRSDIYSLGVMLYEMLAGHVPFNADTPLGMMYMHLHDDPPSVRSANLKLPEAIDLIIAKALAKNPDSRFQSAEALAAAFKTAITGEIPASLVPNTVAEAPKQTVQGAVATVPRPAVVQRRAPTGWLALGAAVLAILVVAVLVAVVVIPRLSGAQGVALAPSNTPPPNSTSTNSAIPNADNALTDLPAFNSAPLSTPTITRNDSTLIAQTVTAYTHTPTPNYQQTLDTILMLTRVALTQTALAAASYTPVPSDTLLPTNTNVPTATPLPTDTSTNTEVPPSLTPTTPSVSATPQKAFVTVTITSANLRSGPGVSFSVVGTVYQGDQLAIIAQAQIGGLTWYRVVQPGAVEAWISSGVVSLTNPSGLAILVITPKPSPVVVLTKPNPTSVSTAPVITNVSVQGTCSAYSQTISWYAPNNAVSLDVLNLDSGTSHLTISGVSASFTWNGWFCTKNACATQFQITDSAGVRSAPYTAPTIHCG
jgi:serine/threonine-protein kinase